MPDQPTYPFLPEDTCLSEQQLFDYIDGKMPALEMNAVEKHLLDCPFCSDALEGFRKIKSREKAAGFVPAKNVAVKEEEKKESKVIPLHPNRKWYSLAAALVLIIGIVSVLRLSLSDKDENAKMAENKTAADSFSRPPVPLAQGQKSRNDSLGTTSAFAEKQTEENDLVLKNKIAPVPEAKAPASGTFGSATQQNYWGSDKSNEGTFAWSMGDTAVAMDREIAVDETKDLAEKEELNQKTTTIAQPDARKDDQVEMARTENVSTYSVNTAPTQAQESVNKKKYKAHNTPASKANADAGPNEENVPVMSGSSAPAPEQPQAQADSTSVPRMYPLKASDKDLDQSYESGVKLFDSGKYTACLPFFDEVLKNPKHHYYEDAQWKKSQALIKLNRKDEAKTILFEIQKKGGKYAKQATESLKNNY